MKEHNDNIYNDVDCIVFKQFMKNLDHLETKVLI